MGRAGILEHKGSADRIPPEIARSHKLDPVLLGSHLERILMRRLSLLVAYLLAFGVMLGTLACSDSPSSPSGNSATFNLRLTDSPFSDARAVLVTFSEVTAHRSDSDWTTLPFAGGAISRTCDLKKLEGAEDALGTGPLPAGTYTQVRLVVQSAKALFRQPLVWPRVRGDNRGAGGHDGGPENSFG